MAELKGWGWLRIAVLIVVVVPLVAGAALAALARSAPFLPGQELFAAQGWAEEMWAATMADATAQANYRIDLAERRVANLSARTGTQWEAQSLASVDGAVDRALLAVGAAPASATGALHTRLLALANHLQAALQNLTVAPAADQATYLISLSKVDALRQSAVPAGAALVPTLTAKPPDIGLAVTATPTLPLPEASVDPRAVLFPPNATPGGHDTFPLTGKHATTLCADCHTDGNYKGTSHECATCHVKDLPAVHYPGECSLCHNTAAWKPASFDHHGVKDCLSCHTKDKPANHFAGQCSLCHTTIAWLPAHMNHAGLTNCVTCHTKDKPANHFPGQCSGCHTTTAWKPAVVNHSLFSDLNCDVCHQAPPNHYPLPCKNCHKDTTNWKNVQFDHSFIGNMDCSVCHQPPPNHFGTPCGMCHHDTTNWLNVSFDHPFPLNHGGANGQCSVCHPNGGTAWTCTACHGNAAMDARHAQVAGYSHNCIQCHPTGQGGG